jgi:hypothetical protein
MDSIYSLDKLNQAALLEGVALLSFSADIMLPWVLKFQLRLVAVETECRFYQLITAILCAILHFIGTSSQQ